MKTQMSRTGAVGRFVLLSLALPFTFVIVAIASALISGING